MPVKLFRIQDTKKSALKYYRNEGYNPFVWYISDDDEAGVEQLVFLRKEVCNEAQNLRDLLKEPLDREWQVWVKNRIKELKKYEKAYTICLEYILGTQKLNYYTTEHWPVDLVEYLDHAVNQYELAI